MGFGWRPDEDTIDRVDRRAGRSTRVQAEGQRIGRVVDVGGVGIEGDQSQLVAALVADRTQHRDNVDFGHGDLDGLEIVQGRRAIIGDAHGDRVHAGALGLAGRPGEGAADRVNGCADGCAGIEAEGQAVRQVRVAGGDGKGQLAAFSSQSVANGCQQWGVVEANDGDADDSTVSQQAVGNNVGEGVGSHLAGRQPLELAVRIIGEAAAAQGVARQGEIGAAGTVGCPGHHDLAIGLQGDGIAKVRRAEAKVSGHQAIAVEVGIQAAVGVVARQGEITAAIPGGNDLAIWLQAHTASGVEAAGKVSG